MDIPKNKNLLENARGLRKNMTEHERKLWYLFLRHYPVKFYKQRIIENYIADFYCHKAKLVIEIDGSQHYEEEGTTRDKLRTKAIEKYGIKVLRFSNYEINCEFDAVCECIDNEVKERIPGSPSGRAVERQRD